MKSEYQTQNKALESLRKLREDTFRVIDKLQTELSEERKFNKENLLEYRGYYACITFWCDDMLFSGHVIGISDSLSFHGLTPDELKKEFIITIDDYLEFCKEVNKIPNKTDTKVIRRST